MTSQNGPTSKFQTLTNLIGSYREATTGRVLITAEEATKIDARFGSIVERLPNREFSMHRAEEKILQDGRVYELGGPILGPKKMQNVPGFGDMEFDLAGAWNVLRIKDNGKPGIEEKDPTIEIETGAETEIDGIKLPFKITMDAEPNSTVVVGNKDIPIALDFVALAKKTSWNDLERDLKIIGRTIALDKARFFTATLTLDMARSLKDKARGFGIKAGLAFGPVMMNVEFYLERKRSEEDKQQPMTFGGTVGAEQGPFKLGQILGDAIGVSNWPGFLDLPLSTLKLASEFVEIKDRVDKEHDAYRVVLSSPADTSTPSLLLTRARDKFGKIYTMRLGFPSLHIKSIPMLGGEMTIACDPLLVVMTSRAMKLGALVNYTAMKRFPGLEWVGLGEEKKEVIFPTGIYLTGFFQAADALKLGFFHPLKTKKNDEAPDDPEDPEDVEDPDDQEDFDDQDDEDEEDDVVLDELDEPEEVTPLPAKPKKKWYDIGFGGFKTDGEWVTIMVKLALEAKGLKIEPIGLGLSFTPSGKVRPAIDGAAVSFQRGDLVFSGGMVRQKTRPEPEIDPEDDDEPKDDPSVVDWTGTAMLTYGAAFAAGAMFTYREADEKTFFLFAYVRRQLGGPPWCYITGLALGFGYNRRFDVPPVGAVRTFPMIDMARRLSAGQDPVKQTMDAHGLMQIADGLREYVKPESGANFGMLGVTFKSGPFINWTVLLAISFGKSFQVAILGYGEQNIPAQQPGQDVVPPITHIEYEITGVIKPDDGFLGIDAVLGPNSFILSKNCKLMGGFALRTWFRGTHRGDWVISLGGYHPAYLPPKHYPVVPRVGILWKISDSMRVMGFGYLAITSKNLQVGAGLDMQFEKGPLRVWVHAEIHALVEFKPLRYDVWIKVDIGVTFRMKLLFCTITLSLDLSAQLHVWGPELSGYCELHFWFASVSFTFGASAEPLANKLAWTEFVSTFITPPPEKLEPAPKPAERMAADPVPPTSPLEIVPLRGITVVPAEKARRAGAVPIDWIADPQQTSFKVATAIPARFATFGDDARFEGPCEVIARPVTNEPVIDPTLAVTFIPRESAPARGNGVSRLKPSALPSNVPAAVWGRKPLKPEEDTTSGNENIQAITNLSLEPIEYKPGTSLKIPIDKLLFDTTEASAGTWHAVKIPAKAFTWERDNPYATMRDTKVKEARTKMLEALARRGLVDEEAAGKVNVDNVRAEMPCFTDKPVLCSLGAAKVSR